MDLIIKSTNILNQFFIDKHNIKSYKILSIMRPEYLIKHPAEITGERIIITSQNAISKNLIISKNAKIFTVGESAKIELENLGHNDIMSFSSVKNMLESIDTSLKCTYLRGQDISFDIASIIKNLHQITTYRMIKLDFDSSGIELIKTTKFDRIIAFSPLTLEYFNHLIAKNGLADYLAEVEVFVG
jgi:uroporphyrinogen-III synthase